MENYEEFYNFMLEYTEFFEETAVKEREKMSALLSDDLKRIEKCLNEHQSTIKKAERFEQDRQKLLDKIGFSGKSFRQIIDISPTGVTDPKCYDNNGVSSKQKNIGLLNKKI